METTYNHLSLCWVLAYESNIDLQAWALNAHEFFHLHIKRS
jgi:hypothetical protein